MELCQAVDRYLRGRIPLALKRELRGRLLLYTFRGPISATDLRLYVLKHGIPFDLLGFRKSLATNGDLFLGSKPFIYSRVVEKLGKGEALSARQCAISRREARVLMDTVEGVPLLGRSLRGFARAGYKALTPEQLRQLASKVLITKDYEDYVGKFVHRKLSFLIQSFGYSAPDLINDLKAASYNAILRTYPAFNGETHILRLAKVKARNTGMNIIHHATTAGRQRLTRDNQPLLVPLQILENTGGNSTAEHDGSLVQDSYLVVGRSGGRASNDELDTMSSLESLLSNDRFRPRQKYLLRLLMGKHDDAFSMFIGQPNEDAVEAMSYERYLKECCSFLSVDLEHAKRFLAKLSQFL